jgi:hypothetical protein
MMKKEMIIWHIGMGKTGTTAIQDLLFHNRNTLRREGISYPVWAGYQRRADYQGPVNHNGIAQCLSFEPHRHLLKAFVDNLHAESASTLIISGETLFIYPERGAFARALSTKLGGGVFDKHYTPLPDERWVPKKRAFIEEVRRLLPDAGEHRIVVFLRRQDLWLESLYNEDVKGGYVWCNFDEFEKYYFNSLYYDKQLRIWEDVFGNENIVVRVYEKSQLPNGLVHEFLEAARLEGLVGRLQEPARSYPNPRLSRRMLVCRRLVNCLVKNFPEKLWVGVIDVINRETNRLMGRRSARKLFVVQNFMSPPRRREFMARFQEGNEYIARHYLGRTNGQLFYDPV